jgi:hypothetical protein
MKRSTLTLIFLALGVVLAILLIFNIINPLISGLIFAVALVAYGMLANGPKSRNG